MVAAIKYDVFLSCCLHDYRQVSTLADKLKAQNLRVYFERWQAPAGVPWPQEIGRILASCASVAVCLGRGEMDSWQQREVYFALERKKSDADFPVIPVLLPGAQPALNLLGLSLWIDLRQGLEQSLPLTLLAAAIRRRPLGHDFQARINETRDGLSPYKGLAYYREEDAACFYGREEAAARLVEFVRRRHWTAVIGNSGCGKSSLIRAGLLPALRHAAKEPWEIVTLVPGDRPLFNLTAAFMPLLYPGFDDEKRAVKLDEQREFLAGQPAQLKNWITTIGRIQPFPCRFLLVVDQWEELYRLPQHEHARAKEALAFIESLLAATEAKVLSVVLAVRADYTGELIGYRPLADRLQDGWLSLGPMRGAELRRAVEKPVERVNAAFENGLVEQLLNDAAGIETDSLPLLGFVLAQLWHDRERRGGSMRLQAYSALPGGAGALHQAAERVYRALSDPDQKTAQQVVMQLAQSGQGGGDAAGRKKLSEFDAEAVPVIHYLVDSGLLAIAREFEGARETVEPAHEALIRQWRRIRSWLIEDRHFAVWREKLGCARASGEMLGGYSLAEARRWRDLRKNELGNEELKFIDQSCRQKVVRQLKRGGAIGLPAGLIAWFALWVGGEELLTPKLGLYVLLAEAGITSFIEPDMVDIPPGEVSEQKGNSLAFTMGAGAREKEADKIEFPPHRVTFHKPFRMSRYEITFDQYQVFAYSVGQDGGCADRHKVETDRVQDEKWGRGRRPAINVSWKDARCYAEWLSKKTGTPYRLPTEAEWEFAARAGTGSAYWWGDAIGKQMAVCDGCGSDWQGKNERRQTAEVDDPAFKPNGWGLYHTSGNVWEWVQDCWHESYESAPSDGSAWDARSNGNCGRRVLRGGSWADTPVGLRSAYRYKLNADYRYYNIGFRLAQE